MVILDKYHDVEDALEETSLPELGDAPPSYETIAGEGQLSRSGGSALARSDEKSRSYGHGQHTSSWIPRPQPQPQPAPGPSSSSSSWLSVLPFTSASRTLAQIRQTILSLVRDIVINPESPNILASCADACKTHSVDFSSLLQERSIENHTPIYWAILNKRHDVLPSLLGYAAPLSGGTVSEVRLACLASSNQALFQALRSHREPFGNVKLSLGMGSGADAVILGSMPADDVTIRDGDGGAFVAEMRISMWQKRMRVSGRVGVEFIARGRMWSLTFFVAPRSGSSMSSHQAPGGTWQVALCFHERSPPTFIDSRLIFSVPPDTPAPSLIALSPPHSESSGSASASGSSNNHSERSINNPPSSNSNSQGNSIAGTTSKPKTRPCLELRMKHNLRLAYRSPDVFFRNTSVSPPSEEHWMEQSVWYTNAVISRLGDQLLYDDTMYIGADGSLHARFEARLAKPGAGGTECLVC